MKNFKYKQNEVLLVAGGGGASEWDAHGGAGGGKKGGDATTPAIIINGDYTAISKSYGTGGTQDSGGTTFRGDFEITTLYNADFGVGGIAASGGDFGAQGGGGWYGGADHAMLDVQVAAAVMETPHYLFQRVTKQ